MHIAIDAKWFFNGNPSGRIVVYNLLQEILKLDKENTYTIILNKRDRSKNFPFRSKNVQLLYVWSRINLISNVIICPIWLFNKKIDIGLFQYFAPPICNFSTCVFIHDVIFETNPEFFTWKERLYFKPMKYLAKKSDSIITVSQSERNRIKKFDYLGKKARIEVIYNGVDRKFCLAINKSKQYLELVRQTYNLPKAYILYLGRLNERKNIHTLIQAFSLIKDKKISLVLAGTYDWKMFNLPVLLKDLGVTERVLLTGFVEDEHTPGMYSLATMFCYVSFDEGFGIPPLEAMASGIPIIVSNIGSLSEVCGDSAYYVNPYDPLEISRAIDNVLLNLQVTNEAKMRIQHGIERSKYFSWEASAKKVVKFLTSVRNNNNLK